MAGDANAFRKASIELLRNELVGLRRTVGLVVKSTRSYKSPRRPTGKRQVEVQQETGFQQSQLSRFENGTLIPDDRSLASVLKSCGFDLAKPGGRAVQELLRLLRDHEAGVQALLKEAP
jgi:hypothetical protein